MAERKFPGYQAVLPPMVRYDEALSDKAKLIFCEVMAMTDTRGYCWATNRYLAELMRVHKNSVPRLVKELADRGYVRTEIIEGGSGTQKERRIFVNDIALSTRHPINATVNTPLNAAVNTPINASVNQNDKSIEHTPYSPPKGTRSREHKKTAEWKSEAFEKLWAWYPGDPERHGKRGNRQRAIRAWDKLMPTDHQISVMAEALARQAKSEEWLEGIGIPHLSTYLNVAGWEGWESEAQ